MAIDKKISELPAATVPLSGTEKFEILQGGVNKQVDASDVGGGGTWGSITGTLANQTDLQSALDAKQTLINSATALTSGATIDITAIKHTLTTALTAITFTISYTGDDTTTEVTLNATSSTFTFPAGSLCVSEGVASGDNTAGLAGVSGDKYILTTKKIGSIYYVVVKNFGQ